MWPRCRSSYFPEVGFPKLNAGGRVDVICRATLFCVLTVEADDRAILEIIESAVAQNLRDYVDAVQLVAPDLRAAATACAGGTAAFIEIVLVQRFAMRCSDGSANQAAMRQKYRW